MKERMPMGYWNKSIDELAIAHPLEAANSATGYIRISRGNKILYLHRWLWETRNGPIPAGYTIDHINGIRTDCRWCNLRCVPIVINLRNSTKRSDNTSGVTGVSLWDSPKGIFWRATCTDNITKKQKCKVFSVKKYGYEFAFQQACDARADMLEALNQKGAGYTDRHGH